MTPKALSREIKFRAWEHNLKEMIPVDDIQFCRGDDIEIEGIKLKPKPRDEQAIIINTRSAWRIADGEDVSLMQFTGLLDKNGKEIFEGDLIIGPMYARNSFVMFDERYATFKAQSGTQLTPLGYECQVIGNIYESVLTKENK